MGRRTRRPFQSSMKTNTFKNSKPDTVILTSESQEKVRQLLSEQFSEKGELMANKCSFLAEVQTPAGDTVALTFISRWPTNSI